MKAKIKKSKFNAKKIGQLGGVACRKKYGKKYYSEMAKKAWAKRQQAMRAFLKGE